MSVSAQVLQRWDTVMMRNYGTPPLVFDHGKGCRVWDVDGREYLDFVGGIAVSALGHAHPAIVHAVTEQVGKLIHTSNLAAHEPGVRLAEQIAAFLPTPGRVFFSNSGTEANECAVKLVRRYGHSFDEPRLGIVAANGAFHGRTLGALAITGNAAKRDPFLPLPGPVTFVDYGDVDQLKTAVVGNIGAVFLEPTLGEGGVVPPPPGYLASARAICDAAGALLVIDEIQSGIGRTGHWLACEAEGIQPDVLTLGKGLAGGMPLGACVAYGVAAELFAPGDHGSTFGGNPVSCAAALAVLQVIRDEHLLDGVKRVGEHLAHRLETINSPLIKEVRGSGLWRGVALRGAYATAVEGAARESGVLVNAVKPDVIRLAPALIVEESEVDSAVEVLKASIASVADQVGSEGVQ